MDKIKTYFTLIVGIILLMMNINIAQDSASALDMPNGIEANGTFMPSGLPAETPTRENIGTGCIIEITLPYNITGTLTGSLEIDFRILVHGPCGEAPGIYDEEWIAFGSFNGTVDGAQRSGKFTYTANVKAGGDVEGIIVFGQGMDGELIVKGNFKDGKLSYNGHLNKNQGKD